ncbi:hypothetical protein EYF80_042848 [Liparis tanakae]|uniref:Uncharacterized protein n=1 Tax=Liparis tanakae TaxID=230148 RepID=A0A4Z2G0D4_9TELE|nr:hypothetical protein EYF80_042848 [Liparis tanakae]
MHFLLCVTFLQKPAALHPSTGFKLSGLNSVEIHPSHSEHDGPAERVCVGIASRPLTPPGSQTTPTAFSQNRSVSRPPGQWKRSASHRFSSAMSSMRLAHVVQTDLEAVLSSSPVAG